MATIATATSISSTFLHTVLMPIPANKAPNYNSLVTIQHELNKNAHSVFSFHGSEFRLLALMLTPVNYIQISSETFHAPPRLPTVMPLIVAMATTQDVLELQHKCHEAQVSFRVFSDTDAALCKLLLAAIPHEYLSPLEDPMHGFAKNTCCKLLDHLWTTYGTITATKLRANLNTFAQPWNTSESLSTVFCHMDKCMHYADKGKNPITNMMAI